MIPDDIQGTINKWISDGMTKDQAFKAFFEVTRVPLDWQPYVRRRIDPFIKDITNDRRREMIMDDIRLKEKDLIKNDDIVYCVITGTGFKDIKSIKSTIPESYIVERDFNWKRLFKEILKIEES